MAIGVTLRQGSRALVQAPKVSRSGPRFIHATPFLLDAGDDDRKGTHEKERAEGFNGVFTARTADDLARAYDSWAETYDEGDEARCCMSEQDHKMQVKQKLQANNDSHHCRTLTHSHEESTNHWLGCSNMRLVRNQCMWQHEI